MVDWSDEEEVEKFNEKRALQWLKLYKKIMDARDQGDETAIAKAITAIRKHEAQDEVYRQKSR